jgi:hypothetical protein
MAGDSIAGIEVRVFRDGTFALVFVTDAGADEAASRGFWVQMDREAALDLHERLGNVLDRPGQPKTLPTIQQVVQELQVEAAAEKKRRRGSN